MHWDKWKTWFCVCHVKATVMNCINFKTQFDHLFNFKWTLQFSGKYALINCDTLLRPSIFVRNQSKGLCWIKTFATRGLGKLLGICLNYRTKQWLCLNTEHSTAIIQWENALCARMWIVSRAQLIWDVRCRCRYRYKRTRQCRYVIYQPILNVISAGCGNQILKNKKMGAGYLSF